MSSESENDIHFCEDILTISNRFWKPLIDKYGDERVRLALINDEMCEVEIDGVIASYELENNEYLYDGEVVSSFEDLNEIIYCSNLLETAE